MPSLKEYNVKLASLTNTQKMTRTMKMVSASKLHKAQEAQRSASVYASRLNEMIARLAASVSSAAHPLLEQRTQAKNVLLLVYSSDKGLCGGFNNSLIKNVSRWLDDSAHRYENVNMSFIGRRAHEFFKKRHRVHTYYEGVAANPHSLDAVKIGQDLRNLFMSGEFDEVHLIYNTFKSVLSQEPVIKQLLPIAPTEIDLESGTAISNYIFEPDEQQMLRMLLPKTVDFKIFFALLENAAGEHGARMTAMDNATNNANSMIEHYTLLRNRARQAAITTELIEISSGAEAL